ncbi:hypothetical protein [Clostridium sp.]
MKENYINNNDIYSQLKSNCISKIFSYIILITSFIISSILYKSSGNNFLNGFQFTYCIPVIFGIYYTFSRLKNFFLKNVSMSFFIIILIFRYLLSPLLMGISNNYSAMFYGANTYYEQQDLAVKLMIYEMVFVFFTIEICIKTILNKNSRNKQLNKISHNYTNIVFIISIFIGIMGLIMYPNLLEDFNFIFVKQKINVINRNTIVTFLAYFLEFAQVFLFIICVKYCLYSKEKKNRYSLGLLLLISLINITFMWSANRMTIFIVAGTTLAILIYAFPNKKKIFILGILGISIFMVILLSSYRLFGTIGQTVDKSGFSDLAVTSNLAEQMQIYFAGPDSIAGAVAVKKNYKGIITAKTFLNDTFVGVQFIKQLPIFLNDNYNTTINYFNLYCTNGSNIGLIIPMVGQGYIYFGFVFSPIFSVLSVIVFFLAENKAKYSVDIDYKYIYIYLSLNMALFPIYNYTIMMQNIFGRFIPLFLIIWLNQYIYIKKKSNRIFKLEKYRSS